ncbi:adenine deaminase [Zavarzinia sp.]|uniref:adenine deaminase n=1 Tax=Zavarzinia sp. TaxID=2027920 RepID=UPI0035641E6A
MANYDTSFLERMIDQALGRMEADIVIRNTRFLNVATAEVAEGDIAICGDRIVGTYEGYRGKVEIDGRNLTCVPGFIDTHVHVESSLVSPGEFDRCVLPRGTTTAICDPHEICNVLGTQGLDYFLEAAAGTVLDLKVQLSSCVPATKLETAGATLTADDLVRYKGHKHSIGLAEFMNVPGILYKDPDVLAKLAAFEGCHIDGHAPMVSGRDLNAYLSCGIRNCHETTSLPEGLEKLRKGMQVLVREGTVCKDVKTLSPLITADTSSFVSFCTDDRNPLDIHEEGHVDHLVRTAIAQGVPLAHAYRAASWSAAQSFGLRDRGIIAPGRRADIVLLDDLETCAVHGVISAGRIVTPALFENRRLPAPIGLDSMKLAPVSAGDFVVKASAPTGPVIGISVGSVVTEHLTMTLPYRNGERLPDPANDVLKVCVVARHGKNRNIGRGFVKGFGLARGALASSVGHDSHNVCVVGKDDAEMALAVNRLIEIGGGFVAVADGRVVGELALPMAGLISLKPFEGVRSDLVALRAVIRELGCPLPEPFLQLAFLPLPVIPHLKITDHGLVDVDRFELIAA